MPQHQAVGHVLAKGTAVSPHTLPNRLQGLKPCTVLRRMDAHTVRRKVIHGHKDRHLASCRVNVVVISVPHRVSMQSGMIVSSCALGPCGLPRRLAPTNRAHASPATRVWAKCECLYSATAPTPCDSLRRGTGNPARSSEYGRPIHRPSRALLALGAAWTQQGPGGASRGSSGLPAPRQVRARP